LNDAHRHLRSECDQVLGELAQVHR
jgi:hypothetical protein